MELSVGRSVQFAYTFLFVNFSDVHLSECAGDDCKMSDVIVRRKKNEGDGWRKAMLYM